MNWSKKDDPLWLEVSDLRGLLDALTVCSTHGRFPPCRGREGLGLCRYTQDEGWVDRVSRYQRGELPDWRDT